MVVETLHFTANIKITIRIAISDKDDIDATVSPKPTFVSVKKFIAYTSGSLTSIGKSSTILCIADSLSCSSSTRKTIVETVKTKFQP